MQLPLYQIDAFIGTGCRGNPAAVVPLDDWLEDDALQFIAEENGLSETAFIRREGEHWGLRWFSPTTEVQLCGHATLASAYVLWKHLGEPGKELHFRTRSGQLTARRAGDQVAIELPEAPAVPVTDSTTSAVWQALGRHGRVVLKGDFLLAVLEDADAVRALAPDFLAVRELPLPGLIATAPGSESVDFVSRVFAPALGIPEDPVTGSAHCTLVPYWAERLGRPNLHALQVSSRGGELFCTLESGRVVLAGRAKTYLEGRIYV
jgi:PhzF family phenazine biosynthesis protein